ncbi:hypothetical protein [Roseovarius nitratireducens]|nr:hypothetical protein [Roseovarius nitratireducens]
MPSETTFPSRVPAGNSRFASTAASSLGWAAVFTGVVLLIFIVLLL